MNRKKDNNTDNSAHYFMLPSLTPGTLALSGLYVYGVGVGVGWGWGG